LFFFTNSYGYKCQKLLSTTKIVASNNEVDGDFIHYIWQTVNSYRTRYKLMADSSGRPITNLKTYLKAEKIPKDYYGYYRINTKGEYEEDIKKIPNQWLSYKNSNENLAGAESYSRNLNRLASKTPKNLSEAISSIVNSLEQIHLEWYQRNISWTESSGVSKEFLKSGIESMYNGAFQYFKVAEQSRLLENSIWQEAFKKLMADLVKQKFSIYKNMNVEDAFLAMTHKTGAKPSILGDEHVAQFFNSFFKRVNLNLEKNEQKVVLAYLKRQFKVLDSVNAEYFELIAPPVPPGTSARIFLVKDNRPKEKSKGVIAAIKIQQGRDGLEEIVSTMAAEKAIYANENFRPVKTLSFGQFNKSEYFMIQEAGKVFEAEKVFKLSSNERLGMVNKVSLALSVLHGKVLNLSKLPLSSIKSDLVVFQGNCFYDIRSMLSFLTKGKNDIFTKVKKQVLTNNATLNRIEQTIKNLSDKYSEIVELYPQQLNPTLIHGDFHGGNLFISEKNNNSLLIDYGGATWFMGKKVGTGDRGNDLGRMVGNIVVESIKHKIDFKKETLLLINNLLMKYKSEVGIEIGSIEESYFQTSVLFYLNRFMAVTANDALNVNVLKFKPVLNESQSELNERLFKNWDEILTLLQNTLTTSRFFYQKDYYLIAV
jgi:hypothetical protein